MFNHQNRQRVKAQPLPAYLYRQVAGDVRKVMLSVKI